jgi:hypothetical protein
MTTLRSTILKPGTARWVRHIALILALFVPSLLLAQGTPIVSGVSSWFAGPTGAPKAGAIVSICNYPSAGIPCTNYANVFSDIALTVPINQVTNPITTDGLGNVPLVFIAPGIYDYTVSGAGITAPQGPYVFGISCIAGSSCVANPDPSLLTLNGGLTSSQPITSTVATGTAPLVIASTTVVPNLNAQLHNGLTAPASAIVGINDTQALINKSIAGSEINSGTVPSAQIPAINLAASGNGGVTGVLPPTNEGTGTPGAGKYVDGATGAWTALPASTVNSSSQTSAATNFGANLGSQTVISSVPTTGVVHLFFGVVESTAGVSCTVATNTVGINLSFTAPGSTSETPSLSNNLSISGNGALDAGSYFANSASTPGMVMLVAKSGTSVTYTTTSVLASTGCSPIPQYTVWAKAIY